jgi:iron-regulated transporter 1
MTLVTVLGIVSNLSSSATKTIIERDWIVVLSKSDTDLLSVINAMMRRIDQVCLLLAPILSGVFMSALDTTWAAGMIAVWNTVSFFFEYSLLRAVYTRVPELAHKVTHKKEDGEEKRLSTFHFQKVKHTAKSYFENLKIFYKQDVAVIGFCLSLVYCSVLGYGSIIIGYLRLNKVKDLYNGVAMAVGACFGILGTICYTLFTKRFGVSATGCLGAVTLAISYGFCLASVAFSKDHLDSIPAPNVTKGNCGDVAEDPLEISGPIATPTILILVGITTIRFGLWIFDLAISQSFQLSVPQHQRNTVGGVQTSINSSFASLSILLTLFLPEPKQFDVLIIISCVACIGSCLLYLVWYFKTDGLKLKVEDNRDDKDNCEDSGGQPDGVEEIKNTSASVPVENNVIFANPEVK